jgi:hypothetical protein
MAKRIYEKVMFVGRATTFTVGLAVILALTVGLATTALRALGWQRASSWARPTP